MGSMRLSSTYLFNYGIRCSRHIACGSHIVCSNTLGFELAMFSKLIDELVPLFLGEIVDNVVFLDR